ncbi:MAG: hypothetical protein JOZ78_02305 [Chroococcidiopsidaceae cyanobacterium CP_BM_ER_R8_30]|nr:hypothetical protein [Chroococcidiopsidaceae cyanobacterium CP_BM_ER_R8_30]
MDKLTGSILLATFMFSSATAIRAEAQTNLLASKNIAVAQPLETTFNCVHYGNGFATIARRGDRTTPPVITWNTTMGRYTPRIRCKMVSQRLTEIVAENGGKLKNLQLLVGPVRHEVVICAINSLETSCNSSNMLFTLGPDNARRSNQVLATLNEFPVTGVGATVTESSGTNSLPLERLNQFLGPESSVNGTR